MKKSCAFVVFVIVMIFMTAGCFEGPSREDLFWQSGIPGGHDLRKLQTGMSLSGGMFGTFILGCGGVTGSVSTEENFQFSWAPKPNEYIFTDVPRSITRIIVVDSVTVPRVVFTLDTAKIQYYSDFYDAIVNPNNLLESYLLKRVDLYITADMLSKEPCLPQL